MLLRLPLDLSTFSLLRKSGYLYVDKTEYAYNLITQGRRYFLSRPRRFGKSLFVSTLKEILDGNKAIFDGLSIYKKDYHWDKYGVISLDFSRINVANEDDFRTGICLLLQHIANGYHLGIDLNPEKPDFALLELVKVFYAKFGRVAVLIDEYDNPILRTLNNQEEAKKVRDAIRGFLTVIKSLDEYIDFVFITGVSSFVKAGLFSGINNLRIITFDKRYAAICGYTDEEVNHYLQPQIKAWASAEEIRYDELRQHIKNWYNGYHFAANVPSVYNPFSVMSSLDAQEFKNFWFQTGTPTFLVAELVKEYRKSEHQLFELDKFEMTEDSLGIFEIGATPLTTLMFQAGYLTITAFDKDKRSFELGYPNLEVKSALQKYLLGIYTTLNFAEAEGISLKLFTALNTKNIKEVIALLKRLLVRVPYQLHVKEEKFYHALLQVIFGACGIKAQSEYSISHGRIDIVLELPALLYVIEVKLNASPQIALAQIEKRKYYESLVHHGKPIILLGLAFERKPKTFEITYAEKNINV